VTDQSGTAFRAVADPTRREILDLLRDSGPLRAGDIAEHFGAVTRIAISKHLRVLREAELVALADSEDARERHYALNTQGFDAMRLWLGHYERFWQERLGTLKRLAEEQARSAGGDPSEAS
jgi:DNA-binding transcriptional ArsR family regulator